MTAYNEADIIRPTVQRLIAEGIEVHLVDNWSTDGTPELVEDLLGHGLLAIDRFPAGGRPERYEWERLLGHTADVAAPLPHDWCVHHDVDQRRDARGRSCATATACGPRTRGGSRRWTTRSPSSARSTTASCAGTEVGDAPPLVRVAPRCAERRARPGVAERRGRSTSSPRAGTTPHSRPAGLPLQLPASALPGPVAGATARRRCSVTGRPRYRDEELQRGWHYHYARLRPGHRLHPRPARSASSTTRSTSSDDHLLPVIGQNGFPAVAPRHETTVAALQAAGSAGCRSDPGPHPSPVTRLGTWGCRCVLRWHDPRGDE